MDPSASRRLHLIQNHLAPTHEGASLQAQPTSNEVILRQFITAPKKEKAVKFVQGVEGLKAYLGKEIGVTEYFKITQERVNAFADATGDFQWIHIDVEKANAESPFGGPIAHGLLTLSFAPFFVEQVMPKVEGVKYGVNYGFNKVRYVSPVKVNDNLRARVALQELTSISGGVQSILKITMETEGNDKPACIAEWIIRYYL